MENKDSKEPREGGNKRRAALIAVVFVCAVLAGLLVYKYYDKNIREMTVSFEKQEITLTEGQTRQARVRYEGDHKKPDLTFRSSDQKVAKVDQKGRLKALNAGSCQVFAETPKGQKISLSLRVKPAPVKIGKAPTEKAVYLTFDDGPGTQVTPKLLRVLRKYHVHATFFLVGYEAEANPKLVKQIVKDGHTVAIHTYSHDYAIYDSVDSYIRDFNRAEKTISRITGKKPKYWRFPGGSVNSFCSARKRAKILRRLHKRGYYAIDWNAMSGDAVGGPRPSRKTLIHNTFHYMKGLRTPIVLMHDSNTNPHTAEVVEAVIKKYKKKGYEFRSMDQFGDRDFLF